MADSSHESETGHDDSTNDCDNTCEVISLPSESEFSAVIFNNVSECYPPDRDIECRYTIKRSVKPRSRDWIGFFKVGWQSSREHYTYEWSPMPNIQNGEQGKPVANKVVFRHRYLPKADDEFYQFCYVTYAGDVRGASVPFQIKTKPAMDQEELECCEMEDDEGSSIMVVKNKTAIMEESLARTLEENSALKATKEATLADLNLANEKVMELELQKVDLTSDLKDLEEKVSSLEQTSAQTNIALEEAQERNRALERKIDDLKTIEENSNRKIVELTKLVEEERAQSSQVEKDTEKLEVERKQYLESMTADRQMIEKLQNDLKHKDDEINAVKARLTEFKTKAKAECTELKEKLEKANNANGRLHEKLSQMTEENGGLKRKIEEESERLTKKVRELNVELKSKQTELEKAMEEVGNCKQTIEEVERAKAEILRDATHEAELLGNTMERLQGDVKEKQELVHQLECELEDANSQLAQEKGKTTALEEDYESVIRALHDQLEGEKALNQSLCSQSDRNLASLQAQVQKQLEANMDLSQQLEGKNAEIRGLCGELDNCKKQLQSAEEKAQIASVKLSSVSAEVSALRVDKETLQTTLSDTQGESAQLTRNSAASMHAFKTAHSHLEKKYLKVKKEMDEMWRERNELKRTIASFQGSVSSDDLRIQLEEMRANNEDLRMRLKMGEEAFKGKFVECHRLQAQLNKWMKGSTVQLSEENSIPEIQTQLAKLQKDLDEARKALEKEKNAMLQKNNQIHQLMLEISELRVKVPGSERLELQKTDQVEQIPVVQELLAKVAELERILDIEKVEKENVIQEILNLQEQLKKKDGEIKNAEENLQSTQEALSKEQEERERLGEQARTKIQELEASEKKVVLKNKELTREVERWKKEVDLHVEAQSRLMENRSENTEVTTEQPKPQAAGEQPPTSVPTIFPKRGPLLGIFGRPAPPVPVPDNPQPWVFVQHQPEPRPQSSPVAVPPQVFPHVPPQVFPHVPPQVPPQYPNQYPTQMPISTSEPPLPTSPPPSAPALTAASAPAVLESEVPQCPVCKALLPPSVNRDEHVNGHFND